MIIQVACPRCGGWVDADDIQLGGERQLTCMHCGKHFNLKDV